MAEDRDFKELIESIRKGRELSPAYRLVRIPVDVARDNEPLAIAGYNFQIINASDGYAFVEIRFNEISNDKVTMKRGDQVVTPFYRFFMTNTAQVAGAFLEIAISPLFDLWRFIPNPFASAIINNVYDPTFPGLAANRLSEVQAGIAYQRFVPLNAAGFPGAGNVGVGQVFNPLGSGKTVAVVCIGDVSVGASEMAAKYHNTALANLAALSPLRNLNRAMWAVGKQDSVAQIRFEAIASASFPPAGAGPEQWYKVAGNSNIFINFAESPPILKPGQGVIFYKVSNAPASDSEHAASLNQVILPLIKTLEF